MISSKKTSFGICLLGILILSLSCKKQHLSDPAIPGQKVPGSSVPLPTGLTSIKVKGPSGEHDYKNLQDIPWTVLKPGDIVYIPYRKEAYHEKIIASTDGLKIIGVPGTKGALPVLDGENAASKGEEYIARGEESDLNPRSVICVSNRKNSGIDNWGHQPSNISIENLEIRNVRQEYKFVDNGKSRNYIKSAAAIWVDKVSNLTIKNCIIHNAACAIFVSSRNPSEPNDAGTSKNIVIEGNYFYDNGVVGDDGIHNTYVEAVGVLYKNNRYMPLISGAKGSTLKDRSSKTVICYNWLESTKRVLDLVDAEASAGVTTKDLGYKETYVYGNVIYNGPDGASRPIHYGGDSWDYSNYRRGTLYFYNNTFINQADKDKRYDTVLFQLPDEDATGAVDETVDCRNNIIYNIGADGGEASELCLLSKKGSLILGKNWISPGYLDHKEGEFDGSISGKNNLITNQQNNPGFTSLQNKDFRLVSTSCAIDACSTCADKTKGNNAVTMQYVTPPQCAKPRFVIGKALDLGAFEFGN